MKFPFAQSGFIDSFDTAWLELSFILIRIFQAQTYEAQGQFLNPA